MNDAVKQKSELFLQEKRMAKSLTEQQVREFIYGKAMDDSQKSLAKKMGISAGYLSDVLNGRRDISDSFARFFGFRKKITFEKEKP